MKRAVLLFVLLLAFSVSAADVKIKDYPYFFVKDGLFNAKYVVGAESPALDTVTATILSTNLARFEDFKTAVGTSALDSDIPNILNVNAIVIGNPCDNQAAWQLEGYPADCEEGLADSAGYVKVFSNGNKVQVLITGLSAEDRQIVGEKLAEGDLDNTDSELFVYQTGTGSTPSKKSQNSSNHTESKPTPTGNIVLTPKTETVPVDNNKPYERIDIWDCRNRPGFFGRIWNAIIKFFKAVF
ncbi:hypothetical protein KY329_05260 [Candidatus Woesearchaeota archaeon]|nr:hypothetical protein [Candidatus Woesearchaeota archaeon]